MRPQAISSRAPQGAHCHLDALLATRYLARNLNLHARSPALALLAGQQSSSRRGRGLDFDEVRKYYPGDDVRSIDWRVTARTGDAHTKLFKEERERPVLIAVDQRNSLFFGSQTCMKSVWAAEFSATIAWAALENGDRIGGLIAGQAEHCELRPKASRSSVLHFLQNLLALNQALPDQSKKSTGLDFTEQLLALRRISRPGTHIFIVSDFADYASQQHQPHLSYLARHNRLTLCMISDPMEAVAPPPGYYQFTDGDAIAGLDTGSAPVREAYVQAFQNRLDTLRTDCLKTAIPLIEAKTTDAVMAVLQPLFGARR